MGQTKSVPVKLSSEQVSSLFAQKCAKQFSAIEIWSLKNVVDALTGDSGVVSEEALVKFLDIPRSMDPVGSLIFRSASFMASFPFVSQSSAPLTVENIVKTLALFDGRYKGLIENYNWLKLVFLSFAGTRQDKPTEYGPEKQPAETQNVPNNTFQGEGCSNKTSSETFGFPLGKETQTMGMPNRLSSFLENDEKHEPELTEANISVPSMDSEKMEASGSLQSMDTEKMESSTSTNFSATSSSTFDPSELLSLEHFAPVQTIDGLNVDSYFIHIDDLLVLFTFLLSIADYKPFQRPDSERHQTNMLKRFRTAALSMIRSISHSAEESQVSFNQFEDVVTTLYPKIFEPLGSLFDRFLYNEKVEQETSITIQPSKLAHLAILAQLSSFLGDQIYSMVKLYSGSEAGFSMRSFETKVFKWNAPTIVLVKGTRLDVAENGSRIRAFNDLIPPVRKGTRSSKAVLFGAYVETPWRASSKEGFADSKTILFQLSPHHDIYRSTAVTKNYGYFTRGEGVGFGSAPPSRHTYTLGNVSLVLEGSFEYGVFRHFGPGGAFGAGHSIESGAEYEDRFSIDEIEVWGCGHAEHLKEQRQRWEWEEREAMNRRRINLDTLNEDKALLEMAGLIGKYNASGGSV
jgi:hypothetical protein